jgi:2-dehydro-3-deoxyphosphooctonate aldolase (KDO 8-P synthase)
MGAGYPIVFIAGPCVIETEDHCLMIAQRLKKIFQAKSLNWVFKASYDKANRTSVKSFRGPGLKEGLRILKKIKEAIDIPILTDVHSVQEIDPVAEVADIVQIPAFLCRQTDLVMTTAQKAKAINIKKGQFLAPWDVHGILEKIHQSGMENIIITERGVSFGYNNLVSDMRSLPIMRAFGYPVIFDVTHSVQLPGGEGQQSGGQREFVFPLARAAVATGCDGLFMEVHENPDQAPSDGPNMISLEDLPLLLDQVIELDKMIRKFGIKG